MRNGLISCVVMFVAGNAAVAVPVVIGGSTKAAPPTFMMNSFWGLTPSIQQAFPFTVPTGGPFEVQQLQVALYRYSSGARQAWFTINEDDNGVPGQALTTFQISGIETVPGVLAASADPGLLLESRSTCWLVGGTSSNQANWNLSVNVFGPAAQRISGGSWNPLSRTNVAAYAILGSPVPEPAMVTLILAAGGVLARQSRGKR